MAGFEINRREIEKMQKELAKEFERAARKHPVRVRVEAEHPRPKAPSPANGGLEKDPYLSRLLVWLDDLATLQQGDTFDVSKFVEAEALPAVEAKNMTLQLEQRGLVKIYRAFGGDDSIVGLTDNGTLEASRLRSLRGDHVARFAHACDSLLYWLFQTGRGRDRVEVMAFVEATGSYFAGESLAIDEILGALDYLSQKKLVHRATTDPSVAASIRADVTEAGIDCVLSGGTVSDYLSRGQGAGDTYNINNSSGFVAGSQESVAQNNSFGFDASALAELSHFADLARQLAPTLGASPQQEEELIHEVEMLEEATTADQVEQGRIRVAYQRVQAALEGMTTTTAGLALLVQKGQEAYRAVFGG